MPNPWKGGRKEAQKRYKDKNPERRRAQNRASYYRYLEKNQEKRRIYYLKNKEKIHAYNAVWQRGFWKRITEEMVKEYGGKCVCCGELEPMFLNLDHIYNDGKKCREVAGNGRQELLNLRKAGWPKERHQLLCCNCNHGKMRNKGICPHKKKSQ